MGLPAQGFLLRPNEVGARPGVGAVPSTEPPEERDGPVKPFSRRGLLGGLPSLEKSNPGVKFVNRITEQTRLLYQMKWGGNSRDDARFVCSCRPPEALPPRVVVPDNLLPLHSNRLDMAKSAACGSNQVLETQCTLKAAMRDVLA